MRLPAALSLFAAVATAQQPEAGAIAWQPAFPKEVRFERPLFVAFTPGDPGAAYVASQEGKVVRVESAADSAQQSTFLELSVYRGHNEEGLLGFAFDPDYRKNGFCYVDYSERIEAVRGDMGGGKRARSERQSVISRFGTKVVDGRRVVDAVSELRILTVFQPFGNHNGGTIVFGPDGMLYIALGDGGAANDPFYHGQDKRVLLGKVLRIDVRAASKERPYAIPKDNPFVGEAGARGEIWCYGLRNPWRIAFDRATGELWCGDVGQDRIEEVDVLVKGGNYGWNLMEASEVFGRRKQDLPIPNDLIAPVAEYPHSDGVSITGGCVYRGKAVAALQGWYVYGDYQTQRLWACKRGEGGGKAEVVELGRVPSQVASFNEDPDGELLASCFDGRVYRLVAAKAGG